MAACKIFTEITPYVDNAGKGLHVLCLVNLPCGQLPPSYLLLQSIYESSLSHRPAICIVPCMPLPNGIIGFFLSSFRKNPLYKCNIMTNFAAKMMAKVRFLSEFGLKKAEKTHLPWLDGYFLLILSRN